MPKDINSVLQEDCNCPNPIKLVNPVTILGERVDSLSWDASNVSGELFLEAAGKAQGGQAVMETDYSFHLMLGCALVVAANPTYTLTSLEQQVSGPDVIKVASLGRFFIAKSESSEEDGSDSATATTPESSPLPSESSDEEG